MLLSWSFSFLKLCLASLLSSHSQGKSELLDRSFEILDFSLCMQWCFVSDTVRFISAVYCYLFGFLNRLIVSKIIYKCRCVLLFQKVVADQTPQFNYVYFEDIFLQNILYFSLYSFCSSFCIFCKKKFSTFQVFHSSLSKSALTLRLHFNFVLDIKTVHYYALILLFLVLL